MANPTWFNKEQYLTSKLQQLRDSGITSYSSIDAVDLAITNAGMSAYEHFVAYNKSEGTSPNQYFNVKEYLVAKANQMNKLPGNTKVWDADTIAIAIREANMSAWEHFQAYGWEEGVNPSNSFDVSSYFDSKLVQLQTTEPTAGWTLAKVKDAFKAAGTNPVAHAMEFAATEKVAITEVTGEDRVPDSNVGSTFTLTTGVDTGALFTGTAGNDVFNANEFGSVLDGSLSATLTALDSLDGAGGNNTLNVTATKAGLDTTGLGLTIKNIQTANFQGTQALTVDSTDWAGLTKLNVTKSAAAVKLTAANTTDVNVAGADAAVTVIGGSTQAVNVNKAGGAITLSKAAGAVNVTVADQNGQTVGIDGGSSVTVTNNVKDIAGGTITVGATTKPTGDVKIAQNLTNIANPDGAAETIAGGLITVKGGSTVSVTQTATQAVAATALANNTITQSAVTVNGNGTTSVTVAQAAEVTAAPTVLPVAGVKEVQTLTFGALTKALPILTVNGLTFTAAKDLTAAQTASIFAGLESGAVQGKLAAEFGTYSGTFTAGWTTSAVTGTSGVVFTKTEAAAPSGAALTAGGSGDAALTGAVVTTPGAAAVPASGTGGIAAGAVTITDDATVDTLATVTLDSYGALSTIASDALTSLNLANSKNDLAVTNGLATTLALGINNVATGSTLGLGTTYKNLNITATGKDSDVTLAAAGVEALTVAGDKSVDLRDATLTALKTVTVSGAAGLNIVATGAAVTAVNTTGTTGTVTATINAVNATYTGGAGVDNVTLSAVAPTKAISLGAGNDKLTLADGTTAVTGAIAGGEGIDTLSMVTADAVVADDTTAFAANVTGFEVLELTGATGTQAVDVAKLGNYTNVVSTGIGAAAGGLTINNLASNGTLTIAGNTDVLATAGYTVSVTDATAGLADSLNLVLSSGTSLTAGLVTVAKVESINITSTDTAVATANANTLTLTAVDATAVTFAGNAALVLDLAGSTKVTSIDASAATAGLTVTSLNTTSATTITGGSGNDELSAAAGNTADILSGGAGNDTLIANKGLSTLMGGAGNDTFVLNVASTNLNSYSTVTDFSAGDMLKILGAASFASAKVELADTANLQDFANAAVTKLGENAAGWFQFGGNTYVVKDSVDADDAGGFQNDVDFVIKLTGLKDLSTASFDFDTTNGTLLMV